MEVQKLGCGAGWLEIKIPIYIIEGASIINNSREVGAAHVLSTWEFYWQSEFKRSFVLQWEGEEMN